MSVADLPPLRRYFLDPLRRLLRFPAPERELLIDSEHLGRGVTVDVYRPRRGRRQPVFIFFDGQDLRRMPVRLTQRQLVEREGFLPFTVVGIHANVDRMREYGTLDGPDYAGRGQGAPQTAAFVLEELLPLLKKRYGVSASSTETFVAGFSLGALPAFDLAWYHPDRFGGAGIFSGALWWRSRDYDTEQPDAHRILHERVARAERPPAVRYWFQAGTEDETEDRNGNGVIDAIDDTLHLMEALRAAGLPAAAMHYHEVPGGRHEPGTWGLSLIHYFRWMLSGGPA